MTLLSSPRASRIARLGSRERCVEPVRTPLPDAARYRREPKAVGRNPAYFYFQSTGHWGSTPDTFHPHPLMSYCVLPSEDDEG